MEVWRIRRGVPYRIADGDRELVVGLADISTDRAQLIVHSGGEFVAAYDLGVGDEAEVGGKRWSVSSISGGPRPYLELKEQA